MTQQNRENMMRMSMPNNPQQMMMRNNMMMRNGQGVMYATSLPCSGPGSGCGPVSLSANA